MSRRHFVRTPAAATAGMASWLALGKAPAFAQKRELTFLSGNHFVPASDDELRRPAAAFGRQANCTVRVDTIAHLQLDAAFAAEAQSPSGHDMIRTHSVVPFLYENLLADVYPYQPLLGRQHDLLVGPLVLRREGAGARRQDPGHQCRDDRPGHRAVQGAVQGRHGAGGPVLRRRLHQPLHPHRQGCFALFPFSFMLIASLKSELYDLKSVPFLVQAGAITDHYRFLFLRTEFLTWMTNSLIVSVAATSVSLLISILAGHSLARLRDRGAGSFGSAVFITDLVPPTLLFLPLSQVAVWLGIVDSLWALIVTYPTFLVPFSTWLLMGSFRTIPREVEECALVDGATRMQALWRIVLPMAVPGIVCAALFGFTLTWNEFIYALTFVSQTAHKTAVVGGTADLIRIYYWGSLMAGAVRASLPIVIVCVWFLDYYVSGLAAGAVKGSAARPPGRAPGQVRRRATAPGTPPACARSPAA